MLTVRTVVLLFCFAHGGGRVAAEDAAGTFITEPQDATVPPGGRIELDCELVDADVCAWQIDGTDLGIDHFYNAEPPSKVEALFPDHERVCSILIDDIDVHYDGYWTCWPLGAYSHYSSRAARITVSGSPVTTPEPTWQPTTEPFTTTEPPTTAPGPTPEPPTTTPEPTTAPVPETTTPYSPTPSPGPGFVCPQPFGLYADPLDDSYFYYCENSIPVHLQCEYPSHWDDTNKTCS